MTGRYDLVKLAGLKKDAPMEPLFIMRTAPGRTENTFGGADEDDPAPPALIDVVVPPGERRRRSSSRSGNPRKGVLARLPAVVPSKLAAPATK